MINKLASLVLVAVGVVMLFSVNVSSVLADDVEQGVLQPFPQDVYSGHTGNNVGSQNFTPTGIMGWCTIVPPYQCIPQNTGGPVCNNDAQCLPTSNNPTPTPTPVSSPDSSPTPSPDDIETPTPTPVPVPGSTSTSPLAPTVTAFYSSPAFINQGQSTTLTWATTGATWVSINQGVTSESLSGSTAVSPNSTTIYTLNAGNASGVTTVTTTVTVIQNPNTTVTPATSLPAATITASSGTIPQGSTFILSWTSSGATSVSIDQGVGSVAQTGSKTIQPLGTTTYTITATNEVGSVSTHITVTVTAPSPLPVATISASSGTVVSGESFTLTWNNRGATTVTIDQGIGVVSGSGSKLVTPKVTTTYTITATNSFGTVTTHITVTVVSLATFLSSESLMASAGTPIFASTEFFGPPITSTTDTSNYTTAIDTLVKNIDAKPAKSNSFAKNWYWWATGIIALASILVSIFAFGLFKKRDL